MTASNNPSNIGLAGVAAGWYTLRVTDRQGAAVSRQERADSGNKRGPTFVVVSRRERIIDNKN